MRPKRSPQFARQVFICVDCETTGLDLEADRIIEVAIIKFTLDETLAEYETLVDPQIPISMESMAIHNISEEMISGKPKIREVLPEVFQTIGSHPIMGHGVNFDIEMLAKAAERESIPSSIRKKTP